MLMDNSFGGAHQLVLAGLVLAGLWGFQLVEEQCHFGLQTLNQNQTTKSNDPPSSIRDLVAPHCIFFRLLFNSLSGIREVVLWFPTAPTKDSKMIHHQAQLFLKCCLLVFPLVFREQSQTKRAPPFPKQQVRTLIDLTIAAGLERNINWHCHGTWPLKKKSTKNKASHSVYIYRGFLKWRYPTTTAFPTRNDHFGGVLGVQYHHLRKHPIYSRFSYISPFGQISESWWGGVIFPSGSKTTVWDWVRHHEKRCFQKWGYSQIVH